MPSSILRDKTAKVPAPRRRQTGLRRTGVGSRAARPRAETLTPDAGFWNDQVKPEPSHPLVIAGRRALNSVEDWDSFVELAIKWQAKPLRNASATAAASARFSRRGRSVWLARSA